MLRKLKKYSDSGLTILRIIVAIVFLVHGFLKLFDVSGTKEFFFSLGVPLPLFFVFLVGIAELLIGIALIFGILTRYIGLVIASEMMVATLIYHVRNGFLVSNPGVGYEFSLVLFAIGVMFLFQGAGKYSLDYKLFKRKS